MFVSKINTFNIQSYFGVSASKNQARVTCPNLAPLAKDTVSFRGIDNKFDASQVRDIPSYKDCVIAQDYASAPAYYLYTVLDKYFSDFLDFKETKMSKEQLEINPIDKKPSKENKIGTFEVRVKSATSIYEKVISKFGKLYNNEHSDFAEQLYADLTNVFPPNPDIPKEQIIQSIKYVTQNNNLSVSSSAYDNAAYTIREIMENMRVFGYLDFSGSSDDAEETFIRALIDKAQEYSSEISTDDKMFISPATIPGIKYYANDIVGGRIVVNDFSSENADKIMSALTRAVSDGALKIKSIENIIPDERFLPKKTSLSDFLYVTNKQFKPLSKAAHVQVENKPSKTGYMAIHINVDLSDDELYKSFPDCNGFSGEIQIIGRDVERLKEIEDLCYKLKTNKQIDYESFSTSFNSNYTEEYKDAFDEYTYLAYLRQRKVSPRRKGTVLPSLQDLNFENRLPKALDFNELRRCKNTDDSVRNRSRTVLQKSCEDVTRKAIAFAPRKIIEWKVENL